jgi:hypothetical protein
MGERGSIDGMTDAPALTPSGRGRFPFGNPKLAEAWRTAWRELSEHEGGWRSADALAVAMCRRGEVVDKTARNLLGKARAVGHLEVRYRKFGKPKVRRSEYRLAAKHRTSTAPESP